jgi:hypothetical protein
MIRIGPNLQVYSNAIATTVLTAHYERFETKGITVWMLHWYWVVRLKYVAEYFSPVAGPSHFVSIPGHIWRFLISMYSRAHVCWISYLVQASASSRCCIPIVSNVLILYSKYLHVSIVVITLCDSPLVIWFSVCLQETTPDPARDKRIRDHPFLHNVPCR